MAQSNPDIFKGARARQTVDMSYSYAPLYEAYDGVLAEKAHQADMSGRARNALQRFLMRSSGSRTRDGFSRIQQCRDALDALDRNGWQRSFHQRMFHENFIRACARVFFKTEPQGSFARAHQAVLDINGWDNLSQEILISTPRRCAHRKISPAQPTSHACRTSHTQWTSRRRGAPYPHSRGCRWPPIARCT